VLILNKLFELQPNLIGTPVTKYDWEVAGVSALHIPTPDFHPPTLEDVKEGVEFMKQIISTDKSVYVHCKVPDRVLQESTNGTGRSGEKRCCHGLLSCTRVESYYRRSGCVY
jgi:hypothetical protein